MVTKMLLDFSADVKAQDEYMKGLQSGKISLPPEANELERQVLSNLKELEGQIQAMFSEKERLDKEIKRLQFNEAQIVKRIDMTSGEIAANAKLLVSAEAARRREPSELPQDNTTYDVRIPADIQDKIPG